MALSSIRKWALLFLIQGLSVTLSSDADDAFIWKGRLDGTYSAKAGYDWLLTQGYHTATDLSDCSWRWIWQVPGPEKIKFLIWIACHNAIPTSVMLHHKGMLNSAVCQQCQSREETVLHCLRDCNYPKNIWNSLRCFTKAVEAPSTPQLVTWHPPRDNEIIFNVDGSSIGNSGRSGYGGLLRRYNGYWLCGFAGNIGISNNLHVELSALYNGIKAITL